MSEATDPEVTRLKDGLTASPRTAKQGQNQPHRCIKTGHRQIHLANRHHTEAITRSPACVDGISQVSQVKFSLIVHTNISVVSIVTRLRIGTNPWQIILTMKIPMFRVK